MTIRLTENFRALFYAPFYAAKAIGAFDRAGVDVAFRASPDPLATAADLRAGRSDVMWGGPVRVRLSQQDDPDCDFVCVCNVVERDPFFLVGRTARPDFRLTDLAGLRLGSVSEVPTPWLCLQDDLRRAGIDPASIARLSDRTMAQNQAALAAGVLDVVQLFQPYVEDLVASGAGHIWHAAAERGLTAYTTLVTTRRALRDRPDQIRAMVAAMAETLGWINDTDGAEVARVLAAYFPDVAPPIFAAAIDRYRALGLWGRSTVQAPAGVERLQDAMLSAGVLRQRIAFDRCVDNSLAG